MSIFDKPELPENKTTWYSSVVTSAPTAPQVVCCGCGKDLTFSNRTYIDGVPYCDKCWMSVAMDRETKKKYCPYCGHKLEDK